MDSSPAPIEVSSKLAYLQPGMYLVRLVDGAFGNVLMLSATPVGRGSLDFFPGDGVLRNTLSKVGDCIVVRVNGALGSLLLTEFHKPGQQQRITVKIDHVAQENFNTALVNPDGLVSETGSDVGTGPTVRLLGHIERVGDKVVQDSWLGDPASDQRIEGFAVGALGLPESVTLSYGALIEGARKYTHATSGQFVGTRQKAKALTGVVFELTGPAAKKFVLTGQAVFLGQAPRVIKPGVAVTGSTGKEPLVALLLSISPKDAVQSPSVASVASAWDNPAITKIKRQASTVKPVSESKAKFPVAASTRAAAKKVVVKKPVAKKALVQKATAKKTLAKKVSRQGAKK